MIINNIKFPIYITFILLSFVCACGFIYIYLKNNKVKKKDILLYLSLVFFFGILGTFVLCYIIDKNMGLSSYVGCAVLIITSIFYEKINPSKNNDYIRSTILSMPLIYGISKLGCFFAGCCYGLPYYGKFTVTYTSGLNIPLFPVQLLESVVFIILFFLLLFINKKFKDKIIDITIIICACMKYSLDNLRYEHLTKSTTTNQIISIALIVIVVINYIVRKLIINKKKRKKEK